MRLVNSIRARPSNGIRKNEPRAAGRVHVDPFQRLPFLKRLPGIERGRNKMIDKRITIHVAA